MAGLNHRITTKGSRDKSKAVALCFFVSLLVLFPGSASSDYRISTLKGEVNTSSYWIQGDNLYLYEGGGPLLLSDVTSITEESYTPLDARMNIDALRRFAHYLSWLQEMEDGILKRQDDNLTALHTIDALRDSGKSSSELNKAVKAFCVELDDLGREVSVVKQYWDQMRIPRRSLVLARDVKYVQLLSLESSIFHMQRYIRTWDPANREYAEEYARQARSFKQSFYDALYQEKK